MTSYFTDSYRDFLQSPFVHVNACVLACLPLDTMIVQVQQWGVVGARQVTDRVLLNGVSLTDASQEVDNIVKAISADALLPTLISVNQSLLPSKKVTICLGGMSCES